MTARQAGEADGDALARTHTSAVVLVPCAARSLTAPVLLSGPWERVGVAVAVGVVVAVGVGVGVGVGLAGGLGLGVGVAPPAGLVGVGHGDADEAMPARCVASGRAEVLPCDVGA